MMATLRPVKNLSVFVDGQNFISHIQSLFPDEFDREHYLPRSAKWKAFFNSVAKTLGAETLDVYWYTIKHLDYLPHVDWEKEDPDQLSQSEYVIWRDYLIRPHVLDADWWRRSKMRLTDVELEYYVARGDEKKEVISKRRRKCSENFDEMERRIDEWHQILDRIVEQCPNVQIRKTGWQICYLATKGLGTEKGVDTGLVADLVYYGPEYDTALILSTDGDYVPAVSCIQKMGKQVGHVEYQSRDGSLVDGISRHLAESTDFAFEIRFEDLRRLLDIPGEPVEKGKDPRRVEERKAERMELVRRFKEKAAREAAREWRQRRSKR